MSSNNIGNDHNEYTNNVGGGGGGSGPCGACRFLRRKCVNGGCIFAPYFGSDHLGTAHFAAVHKVFGASNASKILMRTPPHKRLDAVVSLSYEALSRVSDPVYGCVSHIFTLQQQVFCFLSSFHANMHRCLYVIVTYLISLWYFYFIYSRSILTNASFFLFGLEMKDTSSRNSSQ